MMARATMADDQQAKEMEALQAKYEAMEKELSDAQAAKEAAEAEHAKHLKELEELRAAQAGDDDPEEDDETAAKIAAMESEMADLKKVAEEQATAEREAVIAVVEDLAKEAGAEEFKVDEDAPIDVILAHRAAFMTVLKKDPGDDKTAARRALYHGRQSATIVEGEETGPSSRKEKTRAHFKSALERRERGGVRLHSPIPPGLQKAMGEDLLPGGNN